jgi:hypothetical protein
VPAHGLQTSLGVPHPLEDLRHAEPHGDPHPVQEAGLVGERRGHVDHVAGAEPEVLDVVIGGARQHVVALERSLRLPGCPGGEQQLGKPVRAQGGVGENRVPVEEALVALGQHDEVLDGRKAGRHLRVVTTAERAGHEQDPGTTLAQHERQLALAEDRHQRLAHRAGPQRAQRDRHELEPVGELERNGLTRPHAEPAQRCRDRVGVVLQSSPGQLAHRSVGADLDYRSLVWSFAGVSVQIAEDHMTGTVPDTAAGTPRAFMWSRNSG